MLGGSQLMAGVLGTLMVAMWLRTMMRNEDWRDQLSLARADVRTLPNNSKLNVNLGLAIEARGNLSEALVWFKRATELNPEDPRGWLNVARVLKSQGRLKEAESAYLKAQSLFPQFHHEQPTVTQQHFLAFVQHAKFLAESGRLEEAEKLYNKVLSLREDFTEAYLQQGDLLLRLNQTQKALSLYQQALDKVPNNSELFNNLGVVLAEMGLMSEAAEAFEEALRLNPKHEKVLDNLLNTAHTMEQGTSKQHLFSNLAVLLQTTKPTESQCLQMAGLAMALNESAEYWLQQAVKLAPTSAKSLYNLALYLSNEDSFQALPVIQELLLHHPNHIKGLLLAADLSISSHRDYEHAQKYYNRILEKEPNNLQARHNSCVVMLDQGQVSAAEVCLKKLTVLYPGVEYVSRNLQITRDLLKSSL